MRVKTAQGNHPRDLQLSPMISIVNIYSDFAESEESFGDAYHDFLVEMRSMLNVLQQKNDKLFNLMQESQRDEAGFNPRSKL
ncbi:hypothetical protein VTN00DRAFT_4948 [Thermoascus crustaceus]|uniref:uncharacterized protein n=1 Tax=Thermoascus crustaceus TaxID=5088 RepID=UPI00374277B2